MEATRRLLKTELLSRVQPLGLHGLTCGRIRQQLQTGQQGRGLHRVKQKSIASMLEIVGLATKIIDDRHNPTSHSFERRQTKPLRVTQLQDHIHGAIHLGHSLLWNITQKEM